MISMAFQRLPTLCFEDCPASGMEVRRIVVSDYTSVLELINHGLAANESEAARLALTAGVDIEMVSRLLCAIFPS
jgi:hypothetical protein